MNNIEEFLKSKLPEKTEIGRIVEITWLKKENGNGFRVSRKFEIENSYKNPFNHNWKYYSEIKDNHYLLYRFSDERIEGILELEEIADNLEEANKRLYTGAMEGAKLIAEAYGGIVVDLTNFEHDAMKQLQKAETIRRKK